MPASIIVPRETSTTLFSMCTCYFAAANNFSDRSTYFIPPSLPPPPPSIYLTCCVAPALMRRWPTSRPFWHAPSSTSTARIPATQHRFIGPPSVTAVRAVGTVDCRYVGIVSVCLFQQQATTPHPAPACTKDVTDVAHYGLSYSLLNHAFLSHAYISSSLTSHTQQPQPRQSL